MTYVMLFRNLFDNYIPVLRFSDELFALLAFPIAICQLYINNWKIKLRSHTVFLILFFIITLIGNFVYSYQPLQRAVLPDMYLNMKFWLSIYIGIIVFSSIDIEQYGSRIGYHIKFIVWIYISLIVYDWIFKIFPGDIRYGFKSTQLFYSVHTEFAASCAFILALLVMVKNKVKFYQFYMITLILLMMSTMRSKAIGSAMLFIILYYLTQIVNKKINIKNIILLGICCLFIGWSQIQYYFFSSISDGAARNVLLRTSFDIAKDYFPLGTGFSTYASYYSGVVYSPIYGIYGINNIYGITKFNFNYISDSFWPMIIGQCGYIGLFIFIIVLIQLFKRIQNIKNVNKNYYLAALFSLAYLCVSSLAESAFVSPITIPLAWIIGMCIGKVENNVKVEGNTICR